MRRISLGIKKCFCIFFVSTHSRSALSFDQHLQQAESSSTTQWKQRPKSENSLPLALNRFFLKPKHILVQTMGYVIHSFSKSFATGKNCIVVKSSLFLTNCAKEICPSHKRSIYSCTEMFPLFNDLSVDIFEYQIQDSLYSESSIVHALTTLRIYIVYHAGIR